MRIKNISPWLLVSVQVLLWMAASTSQAALNIRVLDTQIPVGGTGFLDVEISGDDLVSAASIQLVITPVAAVGSSLQFIDPQTVVYETDANYLFAVNSFNQSFAIDPRVISQTTTAQDTFATNDSTDDLSAIDLADGPFLLARVQVQHIVPGGSSLAAVAGDQFRVSLNTVNSQFLDDDFIEIENIESQFGLVSFTAVPEPGVMGTLLVIAVGGLFRRRPRCATTVSA